MRNYDEEALLFLKDKVKWKEVTQGFYYSPGARQRWLGLG